MKNSFQPAVALCLLLAFVTGCSSSGAKTPPATVGAYQAWGTQFNSALAAFDQDTGTLKLTKAGADCGQLRALHDSGVLLPPTSDMAADVAWKDAMTALDTGAYLCATAANFRDAGGFGKAGEYFATTNENLKVTLASLNRK